MTQGKERITIDDTFQSSIIKMAEGNPGALNVCLELVTEGGKIDPDDFMGGFGTLLSLDSYRIYGSKIWCLYKDVCSQDLTNTVGILRAVQLGFLDQRDLHAAINGDKQFTLGEFTGYINQVRDRLPAFGQV